MKTNTKKFKLVLASGSPRRKELLGHLNIPFDVIPANIDESSLEQDPGKLVEDLARQKALAVCGQFKENTVVVGSDTIVAQGGTIYGKPLDEDDAKRMLLDFSDNVHQVYTGVCLVSPEKEAQCFHVKTDVFFQPVDKDLLELYLVSGDHADKAGAYGIQGMAQMFIEKISGSYSNVVGFPLVEFISEFRAYLELSEVENWREYFE